MRKDFTNNMDGVIEDFDAVTAMTPIGNRFDQDNFYPADGMVETYNAVLADTPIGNAFDQDNFYPANGLNLKISKTNKRKLKKAAGYIPAVAIGRAISKGIKNRRAKNAKNANSANDSTNNSTNTSPVNGVNSKVIATTSNQPTTIELKPKGMSMGAKIGIGVAIAAVLGIGAYFIIKRKNK
jgi:hypothetical protein